MEEHGDSEASDYEVQINVAFSNHSSLATRSLAKRRLLRDTPAYSDKPGSSFGNTENAGSKSETDAGSQYDDNSNGSENATSWAFF